jgi:hypothetical protein
LGWDRSRAVEFRQESSETDPDQGVQDLPMERPGLD